MIFATRRVVIIHVIWTKKVVPIFCLIVRLIVRYSVLLSHMVTTMKNEKKGHDLPETLHI